MSRRIKSKTRDSALPRKRSAAALSLQSARHRQRVIPDKRAALNERTMNEETRAVALGLEPLGRVLADETGNTLCPKIGAAQWTCTKDECTCHLKESIGVIKVGPIR